MAYASRKGARPKSVLDQSVYPWKVAYSLVRPTENPDRLVYDDGEMLRANNLGNDRLGGTVEVFLQLGNHRAQPNAPSAVLLLFLVV